MVAGSSPHTRGAPLKIAWEAIKLGIIPAYAGSTPTISGTIPRETDHPRIRGEHERRDEGCGDEDGSSPHTRGAPCHLGDDGQQHGIIPAYAGSTTACPSPSGGGRDHPRIRGEHRRDAAAPPPAPGSSPHTRGAPGQGPGEGREWGIIPAYAGSTTGCSSSSILP